MTVYYVDSAATGLNNGTSWTNAYTNITSAVTAAVSGSDIIKVSSTHSNTSISAVTFTKSVAVISVDKNTDMPTQQTTSENTFGNLSGTHTLGTNGSAIQVYIYGVSLRCGGSGTSYYNLYLGTTTVTENTQGPNIVFDSCVIANNYNGSRISYIYIGSGYRQSGHYVFKNCVFYYNQITQKMGLEEATIEFIGCNMSNGYYTPTEYIFFWGQVNSGRISFDGCDFSRVTKMVNTPTGSPNPSIEATFNNCKLTSSQLLYTYFSAYIASDNLGKNNQLYLYNCNSTSKGYGLHKHNAYGALMAVDQWIDDCGYIRFDNIATCYAGTEKVGWGVVVKETATYLFNFITPWINLYNKEVGTPITPYLEIFSQDSTIPTNAEIWVEFCYLANTPTIISSRAPLLTTPSSLPDGIGLYSWLGDGPSACSVKLVCPTPITILREGYLQARVIFALPGKYFIDPQIRFE